MEVLTASQFDLQCFSSHSNPLKTKMFIFSQKSMFSSGKIREKHLNTMGVGGTKENL